MSRNVQFRFIIPVSLLTLLYFLPKTVIAQTLPQFRNHLRPTGDSEGPTLADRVCEETFSVFEDCYRYSGTRQVCPMTRIQRRAKEKILPRLNVGRNLDEEQRVFKLTEDACRVGCGASKGRFPMLSRKNLCSLIQIDANFQENSAPAKRELLRPKDAHFSQ